MMDPPSICKTAFFNYKLVGNRLYSSLGEIENIEGHYLHRIPTLWIMAGSIVFFTIATIFMDIYILSSGSCITVFIIGSYVIFSSYFMIHYYLEKMSESYRNINEQKKFYILSNLIKSAALLAYSPIALKTLYSALALNIWHTQRIRNMGCLYAITDFVSLFLVRKMSWSTWGHHVCVTIFSIYSCYNDYEQETVARLLVVYAIFSVFAYLVNLLLASRFFEMSAATSMLMSTIALVIYASCCSINWSWQLVYGWRLFNILQDRTMLFVYTFLILFVIYDDIVLMKWLLLNVIKQAKTPTGEKAVLEEEVAHKEEKKD